MVRFLGLSVAAVAAVVVARGWESRAEDKPKPAERFDLVVREDIFAGFNGDARAMERGLKACDEALAKDPKNAEAMVWRGAGRVYQAGQLFQARTRPMG